MPRDAYHRSSAQRSLLPTSTAIANPSTSSLPLDTLIDFHKGLFPGTCDPLLAPANRPLPSDSVSALNWLPAGNLFEPWTSDAAFNAFCAPAAADFLGLNEAPLAIPDPPRAEAPALNAEIKRRGAARSGTVWESATKPVRTSDKPAPKRSQNTGKATRPKSSKMSVHSAPQGDGESEARFTSNPSFPDIPRILPHEKVFPIQIGSELFRLSGASISSDAPSYFSQFFERQLATQEEGQQIRTLYIDRDPETFRDIARHLQGYHISPRDGQHFVRLFADAQFYSLPKLISQLFEAEIFISIGSRPFRINRDLFQSPGNSPNYFTLGFAIFFTNPREVFPGLNREGLLRPPSILPPEVPNRSGDVFSEILQLLRGYPVEIRSEEHRQELLRDCKYFHFKGLEQKLIPHEISFNLRRQKHEIMIRLEDIKPSGISFSSEGSASEGVGGRPSYAPGWINYARPFVDDNPRELIVEIGNQATKVDWRQNRAEFVGATNQRVSALLQVITNKLGLPVSQEWPMGLNLMRERAARMNGGAPSSGPASPGHTPLSEDRVKIRIGSDCFILLDGEEYWDRENMPSVEDPDNTDIFGATRPGSDTGGSAGGASPIIQWQPQQHGGLSRPPSTAAGPSYGQPARKKRKRRGSMDETSEWTVRRGQWRVRIQTVHGKDGRPVGIEAILVAVKLEAFSSEYARNMNRTFLI